VTGWKKEKKKKVGSNMANSRSGQTTESPHEEILERERKDGCKKKEHV